VTESVRSTAIAVDNDIVLKVSCYGLEEVVWPTSGGISAIGILGQARFVVPTWIQKGRMSGDRSAAIARFERVLRAATILEPSPEEVAFAAEIEAAAGRASGGLDSGEAILAAILVSRSLALLQTGDKRAIAAFDEVLDHVPGLERLRSRVACLEQVLWLLLDRGTPADLIAPAICDEPDLDMALTMCCACSSPGVASAKAICEGLNNYVSHLRRSAGRVLIDYASTEEDGIGLDDSSN
jgi:hypothetical protein